MRGSMQQGVAGAQVHAAQRVGQLARPAPRRPGRRSRARTPSSSTSLSVTTSPVSSAPRASTTLKRLVEHDLRRRAASSSWSMSGCSADPHLAAAGEHVDGAVVVLADDDAVGRRRLGELVDLVAQRGDVLARLAQGVGQLLVLRHRLGQLALGLEQPLLERADPLRRVLQLAPQRHDLFLEELRPARAARRARRRSAASRRSYSVSSTRDHLPLRATCSGRYLRRHDPTADMHTAQRHRFAPVDRMRCFTGVRRVNCGHRRRRFERRHSGRLNEAMKVWIDQDLCTGDGLCEEIAPDVFTLLDDGLAYVKEGDKVYATPRATPRAPRAWPTSPTARSTPSSSPPRSAPASASSSRPSEHVSRARAAPQPQRKQPSGRDTRLRVPPTCTACSSSLVQRVGRPRSVGRDGERHADDRCRPRRTTGAPESPGRKLADSTSTSSDDRLVAVEVLARRLAPARPRRTARPAASPAAGCPKTAPRSPTVGSAERERRRGRVPSTCKSARSRNGSNATTVAVSILAVLAVHRHVSSPGDDVRVRDDEARARPRSRCPPGCARTRRPRPSRSTRPSPGRSRSTPRRSIGGGAGTSGAGCSAAKTSGKVVADEPAERVDRVRGRGNSSSIARAIADVRA